MKPACMITSCTERVVARRLCSTHYAQWRHGRLSVDAPLVGPVRRSVDERFWAKVEKTDGCWLWTAATNGNGYGIFTVDGHTVLPHRYAYAACVGPIPDGLQVDHLCRVRNCVNPAHLEAVTPRENTRRSSNATKTHCVNGHPFDAVNTSLDVRTGFRRCRTCRLEATRRWRARRALEELAAESAA